jgi:hypothetical protein
MLTKVLGCWGLLPSKGAPPDGVGRVAEGGIDAAAAACRSKSASADCSAYSRCISAISAGVEAGGGAVVWT